MNFVSIVAFTFFFFFFIYSIPPSVYKKVKQAPENNREAQLIKELEGILSREGLSSNPSEKGRFDMIFLALVRNLSISSIFCLLTKEVRKGIYIYFIIKSLVSSSKKGKIIVR